MQNILQVTVTFTTDMQGCLKHLQTITGGSSLSALQAKQHQIGNCVPCMRHGKLFTNRPRIPGTIRSQICHQHSCVCYKCNKLHVYMYLHMRMYINVYIYMYLHIHPTPISVSSADMCRVQHSHTMLWLLQAAQIVCKVQCQGIFLPSPIITCVNGDCPSSKTISST